MSGLIDRLRKLGILRFGTTSYQYTSAKDMPASAIMDDVYDEKKDLVGGDQPGNKTKQRDDG